MESGFEDVCHYRLNVESKTCSGPSCLNFYVASDIADRSFVLLLTLLLVSAIPFSAFSTNSLKVLSLVLLYSHSSLSPWAN